MVRNVKVFRTLESRNSYIVARRKSGLSASETGSEVDLSGRQVRAVCRAYRQNGRVWRKQGSGRPQVLTARRKQTLFKVVMYHPTQPLADILSQYNIACSIRTAQRYLKSRGFSYKKTQKRPYLTYINKEARFKWAQAYRTYDFSTVVLVDETVMRVGDPTYGWSRIGAPIYRDRVNYPPSLNVWGAITTTGKVSMAFYRHTLNQERYQQLLEEHLYPAADKIWGSGVWVMLQDNAPPHRAISTQRAVLRRAGDIIDWPSASPDVNPIENLWSVLKNRVYERDPRTTMDLENFVEQEWEALDNEQVANLALNMPQRVNKILDLGGSYIGH